MGVPESITLTAAVMGLPVVFVYVTPVALLAAIYLNGVVGDDVRAYVDGTQVFFEVVDGQTSFTFVIPAGSTYKCDFYPNYLLFWYELR